MCGRQRAADSKNRPHHSLWDQFETLIGTDWQACVRQSLLESQLNSRSVNSERFSSSDHQDLGWVFLLGGGVFQAAGLCKLPENYHCDHGICGTHHKGMVQPSVF